jgi:hypothetical protein
MGLFSWLGFGNDEYQVPGLQEFMGALQGQSMPALKQLLAQFGAPIGLPNIGADVEQQLMDQYGRTMQYGTSLLDQKLQEMLGGNVAKSARLGQLGSTGHGRAVGASMRSHMNEMAGLHTNTANEMNSAILNLRNALLQAELQKMGFASNTIPALLGLNMQGFNTLLGSQELNQKNKASLVESLLGIGGSIPGIGSWLANLFKDSGGDTSNWLTGTGDVIGGTASDVYDAMG